MVFFQNYFAQRYFNFFDKDGSGYISIEEFIDALQTLRGQNDFDKLKFLFNIFDTNGK